MEKSEIELLKEFAKFSNRTIEIKEHPYPLTGIRTFQKYRRMVYVPNTHENRSFFIWYMDPHGKPGYPTIFCGAFIHLPSKIKSSVNIRNVNFLDKLNVLARSKANRIGSDYFDPKVVISGTIHTRVKELLSQSRIQEYLLTALHFEKYIHISINEFNIDFVPKLKGVTYIPIINSKGWNWKK